MRFLQDRPNSIKVIYLLTLRVVNFMSPVLLKIGADRVARVFLPLEDLVKKPVFDCRVCGQCILHSTGMTCPMTCPKNLRNGPCGGVRQNGHCEVIPEMECVWLNAWERSAQMGEMGKEIMWLQPPVNRQLEGTSAWINMLTGVDKKAPTGWLGPARS